MLSILDKLQIVIVLLSIGITLYMYLMYRDVRNLEAKVSQTEHAVTQIHAALASNMYATAQATSNTHVRASDLTEKPVVLEPNHVFEDDNASTSSNDLRDILTSIGQDDDNHEDYSVAQPSVQQKVTNPKDIDWFQISEPELRKLKYEDIRAFLRANGVNGKGNKDEIIKRVLGMQQQHQQKDDEIVVDQ